MRSVTYSMGVSLDGYIVGPDGGFDWTAPDAEVFRFWIDEIREVGVHLMGRRLYETMLYWETADQDPLARRRRARVGRALEAAPEGGVLHHAVRGAGQCPPGLRRPRGRRSSGCEPSRGRATSRSAARRSPPRRPRSGLIDEYRAMVYPVLVGGGIPYFPRHERRVDLELVETRTFSSRVVYLRYRVAR